MIAVDTNVVVRLLVNDHPEQSLRARTLVDSNAVWISTTVFLEAEWVLRRVYRHKRPSICASFRALAGLPNVDLENPDRITVALDWFDAGMDFADALHLAAAAGQDAFASFDQELARTASGLDSIPVREP